MARLNENNLRRATFSSLFRSNGGQGKGKGKAVPRRHRILRDDIQGITKGSIRRLARRGGVRRISATIYDEIRKVIKIRVHETLKNITILLDHKNRKTVMTRDVVYALRRMGTPIYGFGSNDFLARHKEVLVHGH
ncbi:histone-fold-containing protein [Eremomyces bilateralis CBS 781.70]|uniref:Histone H4 n=1 Tax=Eremomyces bilateralis CBS 781.70 TaxID=1392243 RepID=A0A6G1GG93_9PEZI|nr:histone-fold-containing protein [Eremomyces bilateralis CBS 781.70]KAF1817034.1 histone-fold-containing protein [Eremomyces bilateralis CBS 781.70]